MAEKKIAPKVGHVSFGSSIGDFETGWYFWPSNENSITAMLEGALYGPYETEKDARDACAGLWFEVSEDSQ
jgi:hypothetical protein